MVEEPSVDDTIAILRGLKEKYEVHHGIRIRDAALVAAAQAVASLHPGAPAARQGDRSRRRGRVAAQDGDRERADADRQPRAPHRRARGRASRARAREATIGSRSSGSPEVEREIAELERAGVGDEGAMAAERELIAEAARPRRSGSRSSRPRPSARSARGDFAQARPSCGSGLVPALEQRARRAQRRKPTTRASRTAASCAKKSPRTTSPRSCRSGPASRSRRCSRASVERLTKMEDRLRKRVVGQDDAVDRGRGRGAPRARRAQGSEPADRQLLVPRPDGRRQDRARPRARRVPVRRRAATSMRIDMSEYQEKHTVSRLVGAPPGYIGYDRAASSPKPCAAGRTASCCSTRSRRRIPTCGACCCKSSTTAG